MQAVDPDKIMEEAEYKLQVHEMKVTSSQIPRWVPKGGALRRQPFAPVVQRASSPSERCVRARHCPDTLVLLHSQATALDGSLTHPYNFVRSLSAGSFIASFVDDARSSSSTPTASSYEKVRPCKLTELGYSYRDEKSSVPEPPQRDDGEGIATADQAYKDAKAALRSGDPQTAVHLLDSAQLALELLECQQQYEIAQQKISTLRKLARSQVQQRPA